MISGGTKITKGKTFFTEHKSLKMLFVRIRWLSGLFQTKPKELMEHKAVRWVYIYTVR